MKLMVDISEEDYKECKFRKDLLSLGEPTELTFNMRMETLIANGIELPKGHGDLIDRDTILQGEHFIIQGNLTAGEMDLGEHEFDMFTRQAIMSVKPVIEADKENEE